jgi:hypothetical protein
MRTPIISLAAALLIIVSTSSCNLPVQGEGYAIECDGSPSYDIDAERHAYRGSGSCWFFNHNASYSLSALYKVADKTFLESFKVNNTHSYSTVSVCTDDPIIQPAASCQLTAALGTDPKAFFQATGLVITPEMNVFPLSKILAVYAWNGAEMEAMRQIAANPPPHEETAPGPVPNVCGTSHVAIPPIISLPRPGYQWTNPEDAVLEAKLNCEMRTGPSIPQSGCLYKVERQYWDNGSNDYIWLDELGEPFLFYDQFSDGVTSGRKSLRLTEEGRYRITARNVAWIPKSNDENIAAGSEYGQWVTFVIGEPPEFQLSQKTHAAATVTQPADSAGVQQVLPDLVVNDCKIEQKDQDWRPVWHLANVGSVRSPITELKTCCRVNGPGSCPEEFGSLEENYERCRTIPVGYELYPRAGASSSDPDSGIWVGLPVSVPFISGVRYRLSATINPSGSVKEQVYQNNDLVTNHPRTLQDIISSQKRHAALVAGSAIPDNLEQRSIKGTMQEATGTASPVESHAVSEVHTSSAAPSASLDREKPAGALKQDTLVQSSALVLTGQRAYRPGERVVLVWRGKPSGIPVVECSNDRRKWVSSCPKPISLQTEEEESGARMILVFSTPGTFRVRSGKALSDSFEIKEPDRLAPLKTADARKTADSNILKSKPSPPSETSAGAPSIRLVGSTFQSPARIILSVRSELDSPIVYLLERKENNVFRRVTEYRTNTFTVTDPGDYRIKARYESGETNAIVTFKVEPRATAEKSVLQPVPARERHTNPNGTRPKTVTKPINVN